MGALDTLKLGKLVKRVDPRTLQYRAFAPTPWNPPAAYSWDGEHPGAVPPRMYLNDQYGDCVIAARANQTTRFEFQEQGVVIPVTDAEVKAEYFHETGGPDVGLDPIASLNAWRRGWTAGGKTYDIHSWAEVTPQDRQQVAEATIVGLGLQYGLRLPRSAATQMDNGQPWDLVAGPDGEADSWGGHMVFGEAYDAIGVTFWTWKRRQLATWRWVAAYCDFCGLVIDNVNRPAVQARIDTDALGLAIAEIDN